ncbi:MAG: DUF502 domain-containing protein [Syntrophobacterales bacterium]|nr:DUF502 domain-containing protein [Syntrophobacterales bacterium]
MKRFFKRLHVALRNYFVAGILTVVPISISGYVIYLILHNADKIFTLLPPKFNPKSYLPFNIPGLGIVFVLGGIFLIGLLVRNYIGSRIIDFGEALLYRIPLIRPLYSAVKQLLGAIFSESSRSFQRVALIQFPRKGIYAICFVTGVATGEVQDLTAERVVNVFLPTTPNPTSGFYLLVPESELIETTLTVEEAFKLIVSGGLASSNSGPNNKYFTLKNGKILGETKLF